MPTTTGCSSKAHWYNMHAARKHTFVRGILWSVERLKSGRYESEEQRLWLHSEMVCKSFFSSITGILILWKQGNRRYEMSFNLMIMFTRYALIAKLASLCLTALPKSAIGLVMSVRLFWITHWFEDQLSVLMPGTGFIMKTMSYKFRSLVNWKKIATSLHRKQFWEQFKHHKVNAMKSL